MRCIWFLSEIGCDSYLQSTVSRPVSSNTYEYFSPIVSTGCFCYRRGHWTNIFGLTGRPVHVLNFAVNNNLSLSYHGGSGAAHFSLWASSWRNSIRHTISFTFSFLHVIKQNDDLELCTCGMDYRNWISHMTIFFKSSRLYKFIFIGRSIIFLHAATRGRLLNGKPHPFLENNFVV